MKTIQQAINELEEFKTIKDVDERIFLAFLDAKREALKWTNRWADNYLHHFADELLAEFPEILHYCDISVNNSDMFVQDGMYLDYDSVYEQVLDFDISYLC